MGSSTIKFGTDGWRAIIAQDYTVDNVIRVTEATAKWMSAPLLRFGAENLDGICHQMPVHDIFGK